VGIRKPRDLRSLAALVRLLVPVLLAALSVPLAAADITRIDPHASATAQARYPAAMVGNDGTAFDGSYTHLGQYVSADGAFKVALWESGPGTLVTDYYPNDEYCFVLEGTLSITNKNGSRNEFGPGETFVIPKGWAGTWHMKNHFKKQFVAFQPASPTRGP
jgi:uncharacterized cupin superfamily protein